MFMRGALGVVGLGVLGVLVACGDMPTPTGSGEDQVNANRGAKGEDDADDKSPETKPSSTDGGAAAATGDAGKATKQPVEPGPVDQRCVDRCKLSVEAKCEGEEDFCEFTCESANVAFITCLEAAASCDKPEWIRCREESGTNEGGGKK